MIQNIIKTPEKRENDFMKKFCEKHWGLMWVVKGRQRTSTEK